jgi:glucose/arabinose dehydrogenase
MVFQKILSLSVALATLLPGQLELAGQEGPGKGQRVVFLAGDEEYRSEESCPLLAKILAERLGYDCTVLFSMAPDGSYIDPNNQTSLPGLEALAGADLMVIGTRFRRLDGDSYQLIADYLNAGKPVLGFRTATHAFTGDGKTGDFAWKDFGPRILGEGWINHHGQHKVEGTRGVIEDQHSDHEILTGVKDVFGPSDVYGIRRVSPDNATVLMQGAVTASLEEDSPPLKGAKNDPMMPLAWLRNYTAPNGETTGQAFCTTMGASVDFESEGLRRLFVNAVLFLTGHEVPDAIDVSPVDPFVGTFYGFIKKENYFQNRNLQLSDYEVGSSAATGLPVPTPENWRSQDLPSGTSLPLPDPDKGSHLVLLGNGLGDGFQRHGSLEAQLQTRFPERELVVRNLSQPGFTPGFRPHSSRPSQWAFPGAERFHPDKRIHRGQGHYPTEDEWLTILEADTLLGFFGFNESFAGPDGVENFKQELTAFIKHTQQQNYSGEGPPHLILVSPIAPDPSIRNYEKRLSDLGLYSDAMREVAEEHGAAFVDLFHFAKPGSGNALRQPHGVIPDSAGYEVLGSYVSECLFGPAQIPKPTEKLRESILAKNWHWQNDYHMPNGVHVYGRRYAPFGKVNYPAEIRKNREMTRVRDRLIWATAQGESFDLAKADAQTSELPPIPTNYVSSNSESEAIYRYGEEALNSFQVAEGFKIEFFASEREFPNLANPVQISFDNEGRLWVATMPSYPHYQPGDERPDDKILIYEDTDGDGRADKETVFADKLSLPMGFELTSKGVYVSQAPHLVLLQDRDGDDVCDHREIVLSGFDHHDTHHAISAFCADPSGAFLMGEGFFLHSNVETMDGPVAGIDGGFYRYNPRRQSLERTAQLSVPNPWGIAFDRFGQDFFLHTSGPTLNWMLPVSVKPSYGAKTPSTANLIPEGHNVRPTAGLEFVSSRHFPPEMQGDILLGNTIGFLGVKQHKITDEGTGFATEHRQDLLTSSDSNFRPADLEFAPDGSLYLADWHNVLVGHMQHSARDPLRDHAHGRIYRITCKDRPLVEPARIGDASIDELLENLKLPEYRTRYRTRRELRSRPPEEVLPQLSDWIENQEK